MPLYIVNLLKMGDAMAKSQLQAIHEQLLQYGLIFGPVFSVIFQIISF
jgi:hypothetical protein